MQHHTLLHRQVHPTFLDNEGRPTRQAFLLFPKDQGKLSLYNGDKWPAEDAYVHYTEQLKFASIGCLSVTPHEVEQVKVGLALGALAPVEDNDPFDGHVSVDQVHLTEKQQKDIRALLLKHALLRGWTFRAAQ